LGVQKKRYHIVVKPKSKERGLSLNSLCIFQRESPTRWSFGGCVRRYVPSVGDEVLTSVA
ncbi:unnamed protein product, partial [Brassica oleracea]